MTRSERDLALNKAMNQELKDIVKVMRIELAKVIEEQKRKRDYMAKMKYSTESIDSLILDLNGIYSQASLRWAEFKAREQGKAPTVRLEDY